jgi:uncharacterized protein YdeI (YjbR/CyaY-like superfamily)
LSPRDQNTVVCKSQHAWEQWLERHHSASPGVWLKIAKKGSGLASVSHPQALESAICYGWIDARRERFDDNYFLQRFTPRRSKSKWSSTNRNKAISLIEEGRMKPAGLREVEHAKADGRWDVAYDPQSSITVPDDLLAALKKNAGARDFFDTLDSRNRYAILYRIHDAKKPETRARRIANFVDMLKERKTIYPQRNRDQRS